MITQNDDKIIFNPKRSSGWVWVTAISLIFLGISLSLIITMGFSGPLLVTNLIAMLIGIVFLLIAVFFPTMRYEIEGNHLALTYGLLLR